ncbi:AAA family ATPase [Antrihabitans sp. YC3-6]|uniref:AAA family ATPase n=1 Tax=Antrihabitans stalagmiti TaxID=2799499 RepID=A0A934U565_9NOCA|nr:AAA family ATPase [Antrihabitans stalagmiti]MBJ8341042.1 AAA family ATPase [Antrihabitans stalagmiti]
MTTQSTSDFVIEIGNCNSILNATITLQRAGLNIKYGANGIGKSTIAEALSLHADGSSNLDQLVPFKFRGVPGSPTPCVTGVDEIKKVLVFNEEYVSQFVFQREEVLKDSFEVFINTDEYKQGLAQIDALFDSLRATFSEQADLEAAVSAFSSLRDAFTLTRAGAIDKKSRGLKALGVAGKVANVPNSVKGYKHFIDSADPASWITWQSKGKAYLDISDNCPYCSRPDMDKVAAVEVSAIYESAAVKNLSALRQTINQLGDYFEESHREQLLSMLTSLSEITPEQSTFLAGLRSQVDTLLGKLTELRRLSYSTLRDAENVDEVLRDLKIDLPLLKALHSDKTASVVDPINDKLDEVAGRINELRAELGKQTSRVAAIIKVNQDAVNEFLRSAGYRYSVRIETTPDAYRMIVEHEDASGHLEAASSHLSYGEKNAFALILFMHHVRKVQPDLVVLDDPVSSFDKTKKYAIIHQLFHGKSSIRDFTTLMLTHDIEPVIDIVLNPTAGQFSMMKPTAHFLQNRAGLVTESLIGKHHISTFSQVCATNIGASSDDLIKCIYLRRLYEVNNDLGLEYDILSSLLHARDVAGTKGFDGVITPLTAEDFKAGMTEIHKSVPTLDYTRVVSEIKDPVVVKAKFDATDVGYEKVQLFRAAVNNNWANRGDEAFQKFVNETYHIENEYVMQLNPREFDAVPDYIVAECKSRLYSVVEPAPSEGSGC